MPIGTFPDQHQHSPRCSRATFRWFIYGHPLAAYSLRVVGKGRTASPLDTPYFRLLLVYFPVSISLLPSQHVMLVNLWILDRVLLFPLLASTFFIHLRRGQVPANLSFSRSVFSVRFMSSTLVEIHPSQIPAVRYALQVALNSEHFSAFRGSRTERDLIALVDS